MVTPAERAGTAQAIQESIALACDAVRQEMAVALAALRGELVGLRNETAALRAEGNGTKVEVGKIRGALRGSVR
jgi:hypothetical protein